MYHGTKRPNNADSIQAEGLRASTTGESGPGIYMTPDRSTAETAALTYNDATGGYEPGHIFKTEIDPGRVLDRNTPEGEAIFQDALRALPPGGSRAGLDKELRQRGFDAVRHDHGGQHEVVLLRDNNLPADQLQREPWTPRSGSFTPAGKWQFDEPAPPAPEPTDYRGGHQPDSSGPPAYDLLADSGDGQMLPDDVYTHPDWYMGQYDRPEEGIPDGTVQRETMQQLRAARGNPDAMITVYRAAPPGVDKINGGDWVTLSPSYAKQHGFDATDSSKDWPVISMQVPAKDVRYAGDDLAEFGYWPQDDKGGATDSADIPVGNVEGDTAVPANAASALDTWVQQGGSGQVTASQRASITSAVITHGEPLPAPVVRGANEPGSLAQLQRKYRPGQTIDFNPASFSADVNSALPYAENGDGQPVLYHVDHSSRALNVSGRAGQQAGFYEQEWVLAGRFKVARPPTVDDEGMLNVYLTPTGVLAQRPSAR